MKRALLPEGHSFFSPGLWLRWQEGHSLDISFQSHHFLPAAEDQDVAPVPLFPFCLSGKGPGASWRGRWPLPAEMTCFPTFPSGNCKDLSEKETICYKNTGQGVRGLTFSSATKSVTSNKSLCFSEPWQNKGNNHNHLTGLLGFLVFSFKEDPMWWWSTEHFANCKEPSSFILLSLLGLGVAWGGEKNRAPESLVNLIFWGKVWR